MMLTGPAMLALLLAIPQVAAPVPAKPANASGVNPQTPPPSALSIPAPQSPSLPAAEPQCNGAPCEYPQPRISVSNPPPAPAPQPAWPLYDRIAWAANVVLAIVAYAGNRPGRLRAQKNRAKYARH